jgi:ABC-three component (ABC-3C) system Middle Component 3
MSVAHDVYSETNPAFCTYALVAFTTAYLSVNDHGPEVPMAYIALPIALSGDLGDAFDGTNKNTGLLEWLRRCPQVQVGLAERVNASMNMVTEAIRFGCFTRVLVLDERARLQLGGQKLKKSAVNALSDASGRAIKRAERLGYWFAMAGSTRTTFDIMGLTV